MSQKQIYELEGVVSMEDKNALKKIGRLIKLSDNLRQKLKVEGGIGKPTQEYQQLCKVVDTTKERVSALKKEQDKLRKQNTNTAEYKQLQKDIAAAESQLDKMIEEQISIGDLPHGAKFNQLEEDIERAHKRLEGMKAALSDMEVGATDEAAQKWFKVDDALRAAEADLKEYTGLQQSMEAKGWQYEASNIQMVARKIQALRQARQESGKSFFGKKDWNATPISRGLLQVRDRILAIASATNPARATVKRFLVGAVNDTKSFVGWLGKLRTGFGSVYQRLKKFPGVQMTVGKGFASIAKHANKMKRGLMMGAGIKGLVRLGAAGAVALYSIRMMKEGMVNLIAYDNQTASSINMLKSSLLTLKNALATAFAPILNAVAPMLNSLIGMLVRAATAVAHFTAAITGQKSVVVAKKATSGYTKAVGGAAKGSKKASKAAKEYQRTLMGFDQINKLEDPDKSGNGGAGGAGGGGGGIGGAGGMFETVPIDSQISSFAEKIKEAWKKGDFTEIGAILANKINAGMEAIPWGKINATAKKIARSIGTFINGFIETFDWKLLGRTISNGILVAMNFLSTLLETIHWQSIGKAIVDFITGIKLGALYKGAWRLAGNLLGALAGVLAGVAKALGKRVKKYFKKSMKDAGGNIVLGILLGIVRAIKGIAKWVKKNIFDPFIKGFKKAFGISSPSKAMEEQGGYMIDGLLGGLKDKIGDVLEWAAGLPGKIMEKIGDITVNIVGNIGDIAGDLKDKSIDMVANFTSWMKDSKFGSTVSDLIAKFTSGITDGGNWLKEKWGSFTAWFTNGANNAGSWLSSAWGSFKAWFTDKGNVSGILSGAWGSFKAWFTDKSHQEGLLSGAWGKFKAYFNDKSHKKGLLSGSWGTFKAYFNDKSHKKGLLSGSWGKFTAYFNKKTAKKGLLSGLWGKFTAHFSGKKAAGGVYKNGRWAPVQTAAVGGSFNQGQVFVAREAGPELVGRIGGNTAVMNNDQIVASVSAGVAKAVEAAMRNSSNGEVNVYLQGDAGTFFRVMRQKANDYTRATGQPAFPV